MPTPPPPDAHLPPPAPRWAAPAFAAAGIILCVLVYQLAIVKHGDAPEYLAMTISLVHHLSTDLRPEDLAERRLVAAGHHGAEFWDTGASGYFPALNGRLYSYHFAFYPLLCAGPYVLFKAVGLDPLRSFQVANYLMLLGAAFFVLFRARLSSHESIWLVAALTAGPVCLYVQWTHPEVLTFASVAVGCVLLAGGRNVGATAAFALASLQNAPLGIIALAIATHQCIRLRRLTRQTVLLVLSCAIALWPYAFFWVHFRRLSLIADKNAAIAFMSLAKVAGLFLDPSYGIVVYAPVLLFLAAYLIIKRDRAAMCWCAAPLVLAVLCSCQVNWNSGMMFINRYALWLLPFLAMAPLGYLRSGW